MSHRFSRSTHFFTSSWFFVWPKLLSVIFTIVLLYLIANAERRECLSLSKLELVINTTTNDVSRVFRAVQPIKYSSVFILIDWFILTAFHRIRMIQVPIETDEKGVSLFSFHKIPSAFVKRASWSLSCVMKSRGIRFFSLSFGLAWERVFYLLRRNVKG